MTKGELIKMLGEFRQLTRMIQKVSLTLHDDIDTDEWQSRIDVLERNTARILEVENAKTGRKSVEATGQEKGISRKRA